MLGCTVNDLGGRLRLKDRRHRLRFARQTSLDPVKLLGVHGLAAQQADCSGMLRCAIADSAWTMARPSPADAPVTTTTSGRVVWATSRDASVVGWRLLNLRIIGSRRTATQTVVPIHAPGGNSKDGNSRRRHMRGPPRIAGSQAEKREVSAEATIRASLPYGTPSSRHTWPRATLCVL